MVDPEKVRAAELAALSELNKAEGWIDRHARFAALISWFLGFSCGALAACVHFFK